MRRNLIYVIAFAAILALSLAAVSLGSENRKIWCAGNICIADDGGISPSKLPRHGSKTEAIRRPSRPST